MHTDEPSLSGVRSSCGGRDSDASPSPITSEQNRPLTAFKKLHFSARRALQRMSRSIDNRSSALSDGSPRFPVAALASHLSLNSDQLYPTLNTPNRQSLADFNVDSPRSSGPQTPPITLHTQEQDHHHQQNHHQIHQLYQHSPPQQWPAPFAAALPSTETSPSSKPRSLLSALLRRPLSAVDHILPNDTARLISAQRAAALCMLPQTASSPDMTGPSTGGSSLSPSMQPLILQTPSPEIGMSLGRLYDSLPMQQEGRRPVPSPVLVPQQCQRSAVSGRMELCLSAPSPHMASLKSVLLMETAAKDSGGRSNTTEDSNPNESVLGLPLSPQQQQQAVPSPRASQPAGGVPSQLVVPFCDTAMNIRGVPLMLIDTDQAFSPPREPFGSSVPAISMLASSFGGGSGFRSPLVGQPPPLDEQPPLPAVVQTHFLTSGSSRLLATSSSIPQSMMRSCWTLEDYSLQKRLYKGKMASVYKGRCLLSGLPVALKVYFKSRVPANVVHMVLREVSIHLLLSEHRSVLKLFGVFQTEDVVVLVMELAARGSLASICQGVSAGRLTEPQVRQTVVDPLLDALSFMHSKGVCHRDIKPENLLFTTDWGLRLADFGVSINLTEERAVTRAGTADYMAPEVERCPLKAHPHENKEDRSLAYTTAADIWSVGVLVYELLVGFPPVVLDSHGTGVRAGDGSRRPGYSPSHLTLSFPASVSTSARDFIVSALAQQPEERPTVRQLRCHPWVLAMGAAGDVSRQLRDIEL